jgi:predicted CoA-substrate-specific enzyme activase
MICAGIDAGSRSVKAVVLDTEQGLVIGRSLANQGVALERLASEVLDRACREAQIDRAQLGPVVATGHARKALRFAHTTISEITSHARGVYFLAPEARCIIEIGAQDSKCIALDENGSVRDFAINDRCASGSGRFLELVADRLETNLAGLGDLSRDSAKPALISSMCVVFAETEIVGLLAQGVSPTDIAAGVQNAIAQRVRAMAGHFFQQPVFFTGGVALQPGMIRAIEAAFACPIQLPPMPQFTGALGAALFASQ